MIQGSAMENLEHEIRVILANDTFDLRIYVSHLPQR